MRILDRELKNFYFFFLTDIFFIPEMAPSKKFLICKGEKSEKE